MAIALIPTGLVAGSVSLLANLPPGPCSVSVSAGTGSTGMFVGLGTALSPANGMYIPSGYPPFTIERPLGVGGHALYGIGVGAGTVSAVVLLIHG
jgi:hypothetical protein